MEENTTVTISKRVSNILGMMKIKLEVKTKNEVIEKLIEEIGEENEK